MTLTDRKQSARQVARLARAGQDPALGAALASHVLRDWPIAPGAVVAGFWPMGAEIDIRPLLHALHDRGHPIALPITPPRGNPLAFHRWNPEAPLLPGPMGTTQPAPEAERLAPDLFLIPLLAFDVVGRRLGYGGGYYDRTLPLYPRARRLGCAYACQALDEVPAGEDDARLHAIATEGGILFCGAATP